MLFNEMLVDTAIDLLEAGRVPALMGEPGIGKSSFVEDVARRTACSGREDWYLVPEVLPTRHHLPGDWLRQEQSE